MIFEIRCFLLNSVELRFYTAIGSKVKCYPMLLFRLYFSKSRVLREFDYTASAIVLNR